MNSPVIILIETSTEWCSAALLKDGAIAAERIVKESKQHAAITAPFVKEILEEAGISAAQCDAVAVSEGPGSYTGLRVGVSTAKGLCFGSGKPLIGVNTLDILARQGLGKADFIVPMIDARRMEVYCAVYDAQGIRRTEIEAKILDGESFSDLLAKGKVLFIGDGAEKFSKVCTNANASFEQTCPLASFMAAPALEAYNKKEFEDVAYFEPFYLKEFVAGISQKSVL